MSQSLQHRYAWSPLFGGNAAYVEEMYEAYQADPSSVGERWQKFFASFEIEELTQDSGNGASRHRQLRESLAERPAAASGGRAATAAIGGIGAAASEKQASVSRLIQIYGLRGHQIADLDPLSLTERRMPAVFKLDYLGLSEADMDTEFYTGGLAGSGHGKMRLRDILETLKKVYCGRVGADFAHVSRGRERLWIRERLERGMLSNPLTSDERHTLLTRLTSAEGIERYLHTKYVGQKRFSLEGGESLIPMLDQIIQRGGEAGLQEMVIGMAHRGRINVLVNVLGKSPEELFSEFEGRYDPETLTGSGDVKYHMGFSSDIQTPGGQVHVVLAFNPSHLEIVNPVVEGSVRARQDRRADDAGEEILPVLIHGDAAFAGQGVVQETFQMSKVRSFDTGGTVHIICNNQIGFTTSNPADMRSTPYCSDVAKMVEAPVFHVNGDDPEAAVFVTRLALEYRQKFRKDVVIDLFCYRRHGHNEADEPSATQPGMYRAIKKHPTVRQLYSTKLIENGTVEATEPEKLMDAYRTCLDEGQSVGLGALGMIGNEYTVDWSRHLSADPLEVVDTSITREEFDDLGHAITRVPQGFALHPRVARIMTDREKMAAGEVPMDWGFAELVAYGSLLKQGLKIRLTGQDSRRGTFFHRHAALYDQNSGRSHISLDDIDNRRGAFTVTDSFLSEEAVLGFEYGYSTTDPDTLVIWEAQFGDFCNGAQVVIDQFISSGESKWGRLSGMALFLPHGYEGQGPEHSSARLERFLQLCAEYNIQVCVPSNAAQMFHLIRRQMMRAIRRPLVVMTPKSLLRHRLASSPLDALLKGQFQLIIPEVDDVNKDDVNRVVFCSGKVYYDLLEARRANDKSNVAIVRIEQLYPFPIAEYAETLAAYPNASEIVWCQEEPQNQGAWYQIRHRLQESLGEQHSLFYAGRPGAAAPASGIFQMHVRQQQALVEAALGMSEE
ncbi:MAG: 2-oxoglutarate dehydrogenase E1 component [Gammaproteobacteria bacterium]|nr:2-oxoglutarate dehydrogenase E1 component [Gammaproteobacteria bacterium]